MNRDERIVVVGAGLTGLRAAERLRELKFDGEVMLIGEERLPPYHRPALSKQLLMGTLRPSDLTLPAYEDINAKWRFGTQVRYLLPRNRTLQLPGGEEITYDGLIIATGVEARRPSDVPYHDPRVLVLRTMRDAMDLERVVGSTRGRVAIVGGGFTGCELAASLRHLRREVTLIGRSDNLLGNVLGPELGEWLTTLHRDHGVDLALGNSVQDWTPGPEGLTLRLTDGSTVLASCVLVAAGTVPTTGWLRGSGLPLDNGVVCDASCHVVGADDIVAAGDVAQWPNLRFDNEPRRVEHWLNAVEMGRAAAESLLAGRVAAEPFTPMPRFWTEQYGIRIQAAGMPKLGADVITLGTPDEGTGTVYGYSREGRLMGVVGLDCPSSVLAWTESVSRQNPAPRQRITAGSTPSQTPSVSSQKRRAGRHTLPAKEKQTKRETRREHDIGYVDEPAEPRRAISAPPATVGRPKNVVDSFSRMLPVAVRPASSSGRRPQPSSPQTGPDGHPVIPGRVPAVGDPSNMATGPNGFPVITGADFQAGNGTGRGYPTGGGNGRALLGPGTQPQNGGPGHPSGRFDVPAPNGRPEAGGRRERAVPPTRNGRRRDVPTAGPDTGSHSGQFDTAESTDRILPPRYRQLEPSAELAPRSEETAVESIPLYREPASATSTPRYRATPPRYSEPEPAVLAPRYSASESVGSASRSRPAAAAAAPRYRAAESVAERSARYRAPEPPAVTAPRFREPETPAELTGGPRHRAGQPEPLSGRLNPADALPIDVTGQMALLDANGHVRSARPGQPERRARPHDPYARADAAHDRLKLVPAITTAADPFERRPRHGRPDDYDFESLPVVRQRPGPADSYDSMPPVRRSGGRRRG
jgi:NADPH-dependent 2,4-dienoyl-CoA reductase/sulfur reductase-like enzyme